MTSKVATERTEANEINRLRMDGVYHNTDYRTFQGCATMMIGCFDVMQGRGWGGADYEKFE